LAADEPVALARPLTRSDTAPFSLAYRAASAMTRCASGVMKALNSSK
jgi:hypothetical protein